MISAMACPPSMPGFGAHRMDPAPDFGSLQRPASTPESPTMERGSTCGLELTSTVTIGLPVSRETSASASSSAFWPPSSSSVAVEQVSPTSCTTSPTTATMRSASRAAATASSSRARSTGALTPIFGRGWPSG